MERVYGSEVEIEAPAERVWEILVDLDAYGAWNPLTPWVRGRLATPGAPVFLLARMGSVPVPMIDRVGHHVPGQALSWGISAGPWLRGLRTQSLEPLGPDRCRYRTEERFEGRLVPLLDRVVGRQLHEGMDRMADALRLTAEAA